MKILVTMPGKYGDILWAMPTARAIAATYSQPVDFMVSGAYGSISPLLRYQPYIADAYGDPEWQVQDTAPMTPRTPSVGIAGYDRVFHLGYTGWPEAPLAQDIWNRAAVAVWEQDRMGLRGLELERAWITPAEVPLDHNNFYLGQAGLVIGFTDEWAELKAGLIAALVAALGTGRCKALLVPPGGSRLECEWDWLWADRGYPDDRPEVYPVLASWEQAACTIAGADLFVGCLSSMAVLAAALGKPRVLVEPNPQRHHEIFQHWDTPLITGGDGLPTFDARHLVHAVEKALMGGGGK